MRASLPFNRTPTGINTTTSGLGDLDVFFAYLVDTGNPGRSFGIGPQFVLPTATEAATGTGKYQAGVAAVYFDATSATFQWGGLVTYRSDIGGDSDRADTSLLAVQPFYFIQMGGGTVFNVFAEPQFTILDKGDGQPQFQLFVGFNMQF